MRHEKTNYNCRLWAMLKEIGIYKTAHRIFIFNNIQDAFMI